MTDVLIENNQSVQKAMLFTIDDRKYKIALEQAELSLQSAYEKEATLYSQREAALANIARAQATFDNAHREYNRLLTLSKQKVISQSTLDNALPKIRYHVQRLKRKDKT